MIIDHLVPKERFTSFFSRLKAHFQFKIGKIFRIKLNVSVDRQALSEYDMALMMPIYK